MKKNVLNVLYVIITVCFLSEVIYAQKDFYTSLSFSRTRPISMGGAFMAVEDDLASVSYNPGGFDLNNLRRGKKFSIFLNPVLPFIAYDQPDEFEIDKNSNSQKLFESLQYLIKAVTLSTRIIDFGLIFNEENIILKNKDDYFDGENYRNNYFHSAVASVKFSTQVSLGIAGHYIKSVEKNEIINGLGLSYGLLVKPSNYYQIGITFFNVKNGINKYRRKFERFPDESLNIGVAIKPFNGGIFTIDVRNLTQNGSNKENEPQVEEFALQEFHFGAEISSIPHISLRAGFYREEFAAVDNIEYGPLDKDVFLNDKFSNVFSAGIGLININRFKNIDDRFGHKNSLLSYSIVMKDSPAGKIFWHFFSFGFHLN